ncbi:hypothetical protein HBH47_023550 [Parastagonospora nodorum]|nr:hypothetical protein HBH47_023550 [Parastagonospora nodorum]
MRNEAGSPVEFVSLGMVILDDISIPKRELIRDIVGGSGAFSTFGYRLFNSKPRSQTVGCLVLAGSDFPAPVRKQLEEWDMNLVIKQSSDRLSTRGLLEYQDDTFGPKTFRYTTPPLKSTPVHLIDTPLIQAGVIHFFATAEEILVQVPELLKLRGDTGRPFIVWEPFPASCRPENRNVILEACQHVDVFSPNHLEFMALFESSNTATAFDKAELERRAVDFANSTRTGIMVVRCGEFGSLTISPDNQPFWLPPFYAQGAKEVVDPTGAGNAFLGGFTAGWMKTQDAKEASMYGSIASSFAIEQIGLPVLGSEGGEEVWNDARIMTRLEEYRSLYLGGIDMGKDSD